MSKWNHNLCLRCWENENKYGREPVRLKDAEPDTCCRCGTENTDGIYFRQDPKVYRCRHHEEDTDTGSASAITTFMANDVLSGDDSVFDSTPDSTPDFSDATSDSSSDSGSFESGGGDFGGGGASGDF